MCEKYLYVIIKKISEKAKMMSTKTVTKDALRKHYAEYPQLQLTDLFKYIYQSSFGCEHLLADEEKVVAYIKEEATNYSSCAKVPVEPLDGAYCRVHLDWLDKGLLPQTLGKLFILSARHEEEGFRLLEEKLEALLELIAEGGLPFDYGMAKETAENWKRQGYPACRHSDVFRECYRPAYRLMRKEYALFLPVFAGIDTLLQNGRVVMALDGGSASGKTTLAKLLADVYDCTVFHMDDFFLRPEQRTPERFAKPGGNVDWERFLEEVLEPAHRGECVRYRRFDCSTFTIQEPVPVMPGKLNVVEGAYSLHPQLEKFYDLKVFLDVTSKLQKERIVKRNTPEMAKRFFEEWIPMEKIYFESRKVKECSDIIITVL